MTPEETIGFPGDGSITNIRITDSRPMNASDLEGAALDEAVAAALDWRFDAARIIRTWVDGTLKLGDDPSEPFEPSTDWAHGGPIIEREQISISGPRGHDPQWWAGIWYADERISHGVRVTPGFRQSEVAGATPLIAAMRAYVASKEPK